ncbi:MAG TPA: GNAT family protein [Candidatus Micrarchaeaceae archaeon]|nr:GNAT family protein [Candidatus Micrarchaeaceae archaeon]
METDSVGTSDHDPATGLPIGPEVASDPAARPGRVTLDGRYVVLSPLDRALHGRALWEALQLPDSDRLWRYLPEGPFPDRSSFEARLEAHASSDDPLFYAVVDKDSARAQGWASLMRVKPQHRCLEVGYILYSLFLQRTRGATEAMYLLARYIFEELGYRRYEWKCDSLNQPSRRAAQRLGFTFEGVFRQHMIIKGRSRDTAWFSILDTDWPSLKARFERWLDPDNFDSQGRQRTALSALAAESGNQRSRGRAGQR